ncbi:hypothetical protein CHUAL_013856 [Chamberlinius hualienensis]
MTLKRCPIITVCIVVILIGHTNALLSSSFKPKRGQEEALQRLLKVFGVSSSTIFPNVNSQNSSHSHSHRHHNHLPMPPQYMLDLYKLVADSSGITKSPNPYNANVIRCLPDRDLSKSMHFQFILNGVESQEKMLQAEFHLYKTRPSAKVYNSKQMAGDVKSHLLEMRVYQVIDSSGIANRLLDARRVSSYSVGWEVFHVKVAVNDWLKNQSTNHGLLVTLQNLNGEKADDNLMRVLKRRHYSNKHPILVLFTDDGRPRPPTVYPSQDELVKWNSAKKEEDNVHDYNGENELDADFKNGNDASFLNFQLNSTRDALRLNPEVLRRVRRQTDVKGQSGDNFGYKENTSVTLNRVSGCARHKLFVDFKKIGWSSWIISPKGYNAYYCKGSCLFLLGQEQVSTKHATVQSIVQGLELQEGVGTPCCVPNKLFSISLLYFDNIGNVLLKNYEDMVAVNCGCR